VRVTPVPKSDKLFSVNTMASYHDLGLLMYEEAALRFEPPVSRRYLEIAARCGDLEIVRISRRCVRIAPDALKAFAKRRDLSFRPDVTDL
jgi:hypothetical protein